MHRHPTVGRRFVANDYYEVGREQVRDFARAVQDFHPAHWDDAAARDLGYPGLVAPITFASAVGSLTQRMLMRAALDGYDPARLLHVEQDIHCRRPVLAGDRLTHEITVDSRRATSNGDLIALTTTIRDQSAEIVQTVHTTLAGRSQDPSPAAATLAMLDLAAPAVTPGTATPSPAASAPPSTTTGVSNLAVGQRFPDQVFRLSRGELVHYAGVSGDVNPIHWDDAAAADAGLASVTAHGMLTMGLGAACLTAWLGRPDHVIDYYVQFAAPVLVGTRPTELTIGATVRSITPAAGQAVIALTAHSDAAVFGQAIATVLAR
ncbi:FAS1-like dehydratase domain-containing protein [Nocardia cyriacigeorgica]|uniref:FAS1-like dehydratase domain-containing protein n=1 Tax=Nocardia cyriacigeorgica TaxID=135487 RepID=UPI0034DAD6B8